MGRGLKDRPKVIKPKRKSTRSKNGTVGLVGGGDIKERHESELSEKVYYSAWRDVPDTAMTRKEHEEWVEECKRMRQPVNRWNRGDRKYEK